MKIYRLLKKLFIYLMSGECVISLVLSCCNKDLKLQTSVVAWLWLRVLFSKQRIVHLGGMRVSDPKGEAVLAPSFYKFCFLPPEPAQCKLGLARKGACLFHLRFSLRSADFLLFCHSQNFPFLCLSATAILDSFFLY